MKPSLSNLVMMKVVPVRNDGEMKPNGHVSARLPRTVYFVTRWAAAWQ